MENTSTTSTLKINDIMWSWFDSVISSFSQRSAATKGTSSGGTVAMGGSAKISGSGSGADGIPRAAIEGSAFVVPAQEASANMVVMLNIFKTEVIVVSDK